MTTELPSHPAARVLDLSGLPEPVAQQIQQLVETLRKQTSHETMAKPEGSGGEATSAKRPIFISRPQPSIEESIRLLDEMAAMGSGNSLPPDFSTADIYDDHD